MTVFSSVDSDMELYWFKLCPPLHNLLMTHSKHLNVISVCLRRSTKNNFE